MAHACQLRATWQLVSPICADIIREGGKFYVRRQRKGSDNYTYLKKKKSYGHGLEIFPFLCKDSFPSLTVVSHHFLKIKGRKQHSLSQCHPRVICSLHRVTETVAMLLGDKSWDVPACQVKWSLSQGVAGPQKGLGEHSPGHWVMQLWCLGLGRSLQWMGSTAFAEASSWASLYLQLLHQNKTASLSSELRINWDSKILTLSALPKELEGHFPHVRHPGTGFMLRQCLDRLDRCTVFWNRACILKAANCPEQSWMMCFSSGAKLGSPQLPPSHWK